MVILRFSVDSFTDDSLQDAVFDLFLCVKYKETDPCKMKARKSHKKIITMIEKQTRYKKHDKNKNHRKNLRKDFNPTTPLG